MSPVLAASLRVLIAVGLMMANGVMMIYMLRKVLGHLHLRYGPLHVGWHGLLQTPLDVVKLLTKEDVTPRAVDRWLFRLAPLAVFVPSLMAYAALPFGPGWSIVSLDTGLLYTFAVLSLVPIGLLMAGWASANKWSLLGGMRAAAQQIAYEVPLLLSVLPVVLIAGTMSLGGIVDAQQGLWLGVLPRWFVLNPLGLVAFALFVVAGLVESNQTPFDMSEAESELVTGFATEYSAMKFGLLFLSEFSNQFILSAIGVTVFFGGWMLPWIPVEWYAEIPVLPAAVFIFKVYIGIFVMMWIRGTYPRVRVDRMMELGWKRLIPAGLALVLLTGFIQKAVM
ncbi:MAG: NADH-quinone oxidoreductase subunit NuoH [Anaerosomatales bacterium]|nr:NADH-quinone oxidoreductase subunit NuoH [Anaerosomatales bacterium]